MGPKGFIYKLEMIIARIVQVLMSIVFVAVFFFTVCLTSYVGTVIYLWNKYGTRMTTEMIGQVLPDAFIVSLTVWLVVLVLYKRYMD